MRRIDKILGWMLIILIVVCFVGACLSIIKSAINLPNRKVKRIAELIIFVVGCGAVALAGHPRFSDKDEEIEEGGIEVLYMLFGGMAICGVFYLYHIFIFMKMF